MKLQAVFSRGSFFFRYAIRWQQTAVVDSSRLIYFTMNDLTYSTH